MTTSDEPSDEEKARLDWLAAPMPRHEFFQARIHDLEIVADLASALVSEMSGDRNAAREQLMEVTKGLSRALTLMGAKGRAEK